MLLAIVVGPGSDTGDQSMTPLASVVEEDADEGEEDTHNTGEGGVQAPPSSAGDESGNGSSSGPSLNDILSAPPCPTLSMVTKHSNGTLNLWQLTFADKTKFSQVLYFCHFIEQVKFYKISII